MDDEKLSKILQDLQLSVTVLYNEMGLTDEVLDLQTNINKLRHKYNIVDESHLTKDNEGFVQ